MAQINESVKTRRWQARAGLSLRGSRFERPVPLMRLGEARFEERRGRWDAA
jgi:hypothetical protein